LAAGEHSLPGECSGVGLSGVRRGQRRFRADLRCLGAGHWERKSELVFGKTPGSGGALQVFGLVMGVTRRRALGALVGAQSGRALSHRPLKRRSLVSRRDCRPGLARPGLDQSGFLCRLRCVVGGSDGDLHLVTVTSVRQQAGPGRAGDVLRTLMARGLAWAAALGRR